jgi:hypothetical protein
VKIIIIGDLAPEKTVYREIEVPTLILVICTFHAAHFAPLCAYLQRIQTDLDVSLSLSLSLYLHDYTAVQYATLPLPYYHHASTVLTLVRLSFPPPSFIISYYLMTELP